MCPCNLLIGLSTILNHPVAGYEIAASQTLASLAVALNKSFSFDVNVVSHVPWESSGVAHSSALHHYCFGFRQKCIECLVSLRWRQISSSRVRPWSPCQKFVRLRQECFQKVSPAVEGCRRLQKPSRDSLGSESAVSTDKTGLSGLPPPASTNAHL